MRGIKLAVVALAAQVAVTAAPAYAHDEGAPARPPTTKERAQFELRRSRAARAADAGGSPAKLGIFGAPFAEPDISGQQTDKTCVDKPDGSKACKPAAGT